MNLRERAIDGLIQELIVFFKKIDKRLENEYSGMK
jgi:hypothetical protein